MSIAAVTVWLLVLYAGPHQGYVTVPDIASESACWELSSKLSATGIKTYTFASQWQRCVPYQRAPR